MNEDVIYTEEEPRLHIIIPECCREGWESCPHVPKRPDKIKTNVGL